MIARVIYRLPYEENFYEVSGAIFANNIPSNSSSFVINSFDNKTKYCIHPEKIKKANAIHDFGNTFNFSNYHFNQEEVKYETALSLALEKVNQQELFKVIISKKTAFDFDSSKTFLFINALSKAFPEAFVYLLQLPNNEIWFGASPEILIQENKPYFETMALAGTMKIEEASKIDNWQLKEREEHQFVCDFIEQVFRENNLSFTQSTTQPVKTGKIFHLKKTYKIESNHCTIFDLANKLHPTPAVCGLPAEKAFEFIQIQEGYSRELYTGYLGPINIDNKSALFVNLRCGKLYQNKMELFAGGGINPGSDLISESEEVSIKMQNTYGIYQSL